VADREAKPLPLDAHDDQADAGPRVEPMEEPQLGRDEDGRDSSAAGGQRGPPRGQPVDLRLGFTLGRARVNPFDLLRGPETADSEEDWSETTAQKGYPETYRATAVRDESQQCGVD
jgi:hypothetical protein